MTVHASVELVEAMRGVGGADGDTGYWKAVCGAFVEAESQECVWGWDANNWDGRHGYGPNSFVRVEELRKQCSVGSVTCPSCLAAMRAATCPVRWDFLETLGLAPRLEAK